MRQVICDHCAGVIEQYFDSQASAHLDFNDAAEVMRRTDHGKPRLVLSLKLSGEYHFECVGKEVTRILVDGGHSLPDLVILACGDGAVPEAVS